MKTFIKRLLDKATAPYRAAGKFAWHFARGKLGGDPVFAGLLEIGAFPAEASVLDLGCGQGLLASWLTTAQQMHADGDWPATWPAPPRLSSYRGIELMQSDVERARDALGNKATVEQGDIRTAEFGKVNAVVILDVLHYMEPQDQVQVLRRVRESLQPAGKLILRIGDQAGGLPFLYSKLVDLVIFYIRGHRIARLHTRTLAEWRELLTREGFAVESMPMSKGTPFASTLLLASVGQRG